jgi:hypothetical protein
MSLIHNCLQLSNPYATLFHSPVTLNDVTNTIRLIDQKIGTYVSSYLDKQAPTNKELCLILIRAAPFYLFSQSTIGNYAIVASSAAWVPLTHNSKPELEMSMKVMQAIGTALFLNALVTSTKIFNSTSSPSELISIPLNLAYAAAYFYLSSSQEKLLRMQIREEFEQRKTIHFSHMQEVY